jgi:hypothetical protein
LHLIKISLACSSDARYLVREESQLRFFRRRYSHSLEHITPCSSLHQSQLLPAGDTQELIDRTNIPLRILKKSIQPSIALLNRLLAADHLATSTLNRLGRLVQVLDKPVQDNAARPRRRKATGIVAIRARNDAAAELDVGVPVDDAGGGVALAFLGLARTGFNGPVEDGCVEGLGC